MVTLSAFADEISSDLDTQLDVLSSENIRYLELRGVWNKNVLRLTDDELLMVRNRLESMGIRVSSIGSPIGKIQITDSFEEHLADFERAIHVAKVFGTKFIRIFSFFIPSGEDPAQYRGEVMSRINELVRRAERANIVLLHENEKHIYGDTPERCLDILETCASPSLRMAFDPANFVQCNVKPMSTAYPLLDSFIEYVHIKDACFEDGRVVPAGQGDGDLPALVRALKSRGYEGFLSIEPHLASANAFLGFSGPDLFRVASQALKSLLEADGVSWN
jgi:sugar phosphate isomerase/epimerase